jgi:hypothetical protein
MNVREEQYDSHATIKYYMLLFAGCNNDHIAPCYDQQCKYAKVEYGNYAGDGVYITKGNYIEYTKDSVYVAKGEYGKYAKEDASVKEGHHEPPVKEGNNKPLAKMATRLGKTMSLSPLKQLTVYTMQDNNEPLTTKSNWATTFDNCKGAKAPAVKLIVSMRTPHHCHGTPNCLH